MHGLRRDDVCRAPGTRPYDPTVRAFAFLRGINVGNRRPKKDDLITAVTGPELSDVSTYQASGNVVFETDVGAAELEPVLERRLEERLGYDVVCFVRTLDELAEITAELPTPGPDEKHQIVFFADALGSHTREAYEEAAGSTDTLRWRDRELIWTHRGGMLESPLGDAMQKLIPPANTVRTAGTVERLVAKFR